LGGVDEGASGGLGDLRAEVGVARIVVRYSLAELVSNPLLTSTKRGCGSRNQGMYWSTRPALISRMVAV
jgi:hypothetical protein